MKVLRLAVVAVMSLFLAGNVFASGPKGKADKQTIKPIVLRYAHVGVPGEEQTRWAAEFAKRVNEETHGRVQIQVFPNSELGGINEIIDGVKSGSIDMAQHVFSSLAKYVPQFAILNAPYIYKNPAQCLRATSPYTSPVVKQLNKELIKKTGIRVIGNFYRGARELTATIPIYSPKDLHGKKIRGIAVPVWMSMLRGMGATPVPITFAELQTALMTGVVIGQENPLNTIQSSKMYEVQKYVMMTNHMYSVLVVFANNAVWEKIPTRDRKIIEHVSQEMAQVSLKWNRQSQKALIKKLKSEGMKFIDKSNGLQVSAFRKAVLKQIHKDFPSWAPWIKRLQSVQ